MTFFELGQKAYTAGLRAPYQCSATSTKLAGRKIGDKRTVPDLKEWGRGFNSANVAEMKIKFPEMYA